MLAPTWARLTQLRALTIDSLPEGPRFPRLRHLVVLVVSSPRAAPFRSSLGSLVSASPALESVTLVCPGYGILDLLKAVAERGVPHLLCRIPRHIRDAPTLRAGLREFPVTLAILPLREAP